MGADHHDLVGVSGAGLGDDVALRPAAVLPVLPGRLIGWGGGLEPGVTQHVDHIFDAGVVAGGPGGPVAVVFVGDLLQCLKVLHCPGTAHLTCQLLHQWPDRRGGGAGGGGGMRRGGRRLHCSRTAGRGGENDRDLHEPEFRVPKRRQALLPSRSGLRLRWAVPTSRSTPGARCEVPDYAAGERWSLACWTRAYTSGEISEEAPQIPDQRL